MAMTFDDMYTVDTGTATTGDTLTYTTGTTSGDGGWTPVKIYNPEPQIKIKDPYAGKTVKTVDDIIKKKAFWDGVEWEEFKTYRPRKSITGKIIIGKMHKRHKKIVIKGFTSRTGHVISTVLGRETSRTQYANTKELFEEKLKGKA